MNHFFFIKDIYFENIFKVKINRITSLTIGNAQPVWFLTIKSKFLINAKTLKRNLKPMRKKGAQWTKIMVCNAFCMENVYTHRSPLLFIGIWVVILKELCQQKQIYADLKIGAFVLFISSHRFDQSHFAFYNFFEIF